jgi:uncharacterized tellurite resistance protein B-like protein
VGLIVNGGTILGMLEPGAAELTREELIVLAAAVREMIKADGVVSDSEADAAAALARRLGLDSKTWAALWADAQRELPNVDAVVHAAARDLTRANAREIVYELLYEIATDGSIVDSEWDLLEWLDETWRFVDAQQGR